MRLYKSTLVLSSPFATPWHADTVFGHLCWHILRHQGPEVLENFLQKYTGIRGSGEDRHPPILLSDGFPGDYLPRPILPGASQAGAFKKLERIKRQREDKELAEARWLTLDEFNRVRLGEDVTPSVNEEEVGILSNVTSKNQIDRLTNTAGGEAGQLYDFAAYVMPVVSIYWRMDDESLDLVRTFLLDLKNTGYGKRKSVGYGRVQSVELIHFNGFADVPGANGFITLSRFVPAKGDPVEGFWKTTVKYGKLGEEFAVGRNPFKHPLLQLECGSCFRDAEPREGYGQLISRISAREEPKQYAFAFAIPIWLPEDCLK